MNDITAIIGGSNVRQLESGLFQEMSALERADFSKCHDLLEIPASCFLSCSGLESVIGINNIVSVGDCAFSKCDNID